MSCGIYIIEHVVVSAKYIGLTSRPFESRWNDYKERFPRKDGWTYRVLEECEKPQLKIRERFHIAEAKLNGIPLLNKNNGGGGKLAGYQRTDENKRNLVIARTGIKIKKHTAEANAAKSLRQMGHKGCIHTDATKENLSEKAKLQFATDEQRKAHAEKTKAGMSKSSKKIGRPKKGEPKNG